MALLGALAKFGMGMVHGDGNTRQCMATSVVAYKQAFGFDAPPYTYADFEESDVIVLVGSNLCIAHPIMWERVWRNQAPLANTAKQKNFVIHRQPEDDREDDRNRHGVQITWRIEAQESVGPAPDEDGGEDPEARADAEHVGHHGLQRERDTTAA